MPEFIGTTTSPIRPGDAYPMRAEPWNRVVDAEHITSGERHVDWQSGEIPYTPTATKAIVKYDDVEIDDPIYRLQPGMPLGVTGMLQNSGDEWRFHEKITFRGVRPNISHFAKCVITTKDMEVGSLHECAIAGTTQARIYTLPQHRWMEYADIPLDLVSRNMYLHPSGSWRVMFSDMDTRAAGDTEGWAVLHYVGPWQRVMWAKAAEEILFLSKGDFWPYVVTDKSTWPFTGEYKMDSPLETHYSFINGGTIEAQTPIAVKWFNDLGRWEVILAQCPQECLCAQPEAPP